jgi:hypothetical protein
MATTIKLNHVINCDADRFWEVFFDRAYNDELYKVALGFPEFSILEQKETPTGIYRKAAGQPKMNAPGPVAKLLGSNFKYVEEGNFDRAAGVWKWKLTPSTLADKIRNEGSVRLEPGGEGKVRRIADLVVEAKVFGVGGMLEGTAEKSLRDGWEKSAVFLNEWLAKHPK